MASHENAMGFQHGNESVLSRLSPGLSTDVSGMAISSCVSMATPSNGANPFLASSAWDPLVSLSQAQTFGGSCSSISDFSNSSYPLVLENQGMRSTSHLVQYMSDPNFADMVPKVPSYGSGSFSEMVGSFGRPGSGDIANTGYTKTNGEQSQGEDSTLDQGTAGSAPCENTRKRGLDHNSTFSPNKNAEDDVMKDSSEKSSDGEKKPKVEQNPSAHLRGGKQSVKQAKDNSHGGEASNENFIHVRARRGQATNSHSVAERVRREKISERMRLLQELVPGCSKITGKAVMLDEIINYVQSLQRQVEFLSMKLATVNPELTFDLNRILSKDIFQSRMEGHGPIGGCGVGISSSQPFPTGTFRETLGVEGMPSTSTQFLPLPQTVLDHEFQSFYGMGYDSSTALDNLEPNGRLKTVL